MVKRENGAIKYIDNLQLLQEKLNYEESCFFENQNTATYCFVQYIPEVTGILIGRLVTQTPILIAYITRFINMIFCITIIYFAIKIIPFGKNILLIFSILPIVMEGFSIISPDGITIAICALYIAYTLYISFDKNKKCGTKETVILTIIGAIVSLCKIVYMPLIFLCLIIPKDKFKDKRERIISIILGVGVILNLIWLVFGSVILLNTNTNTYIGSSKNGTILKLATILNNPFLYIQKIFYTIVTKGHQYFLSLFGGQFEGIEIIPYITCGIALLATITDEKLKVSFKKYQKIIIFLIVLVITALIFTSLYIQWSDNELDYIDGVQGRYFLPILPLILILLAGIKLKSNYTNTGITKLICISGIIIQIYTIVAVMAVHI